MKLEYSEFYDSYILTFDENDKCNYCDNVLVCPLIRAFEQGAYIISSRRDGEVPTSEFCDMFKPNDRIRRIESGLNKKGKAKDI